MSTAAALANPPEDPRDTPQSPAVLTPVPEVATRVGTRADALTPAKRVRNYSTAVSQIGTPPDVWSDDRPSLKKLWYYATHGVWTGEKTPARMLAVMYAFGLAIPLTALGYYLLWLVERPARLIIAATVVGLFILVTH
ncbi:hypothetical protein [Kribbella catacumbae]|uniref:hypothetical protein n=1 Tax=Kribbella catacumbae TaxID=460086 RepID=UPI000363C012|nr:hypothetical protein [Kribbella catacumbae]